MPMIITSHKIKFHSTVFCTIL